MNCNIRKQRIKEFRELARRFLKLYPLDTEYGKLCDRCDRILPENMFYIGNICKDCHYEQMYMIRRNKRLKIISHYSPRMICQWCGEKDIDLLTLDHKNGSGNIHRRQKHHDTINGEIINKNFPQDYQILCPNCQFVKRVNNNECGNQYI